MTDPSLSVLRDQQHQAEYFFQGWTPEHTVIAVILLIGAILWWWHRGEPSNGTD